MLLPLTHQSRTGHGGLAKDDDSANKKLFSRCESEEWLLAGEVMNRIVEHIDQRTPWREENFYSVVGHFEVVKRQRGRIPLIPRLGLSSASVAKEEIIPFELILLLIFHFILRSMLGGNLFHLASTQLNNS